MAAKKLIIIVFVFVCSAASEEGSPEKNLEQTKNPTGTKPPYIELVSFEDYRGGASSESVNSTTTTDAKLQIKTTTTNEFPTDEAEPLNKADGGSATSSSSSSSQGAEPKHLPKMVQSEGTQEVPKIRENPPKKRETDKKEYINNPMINKTSTPANMSTEKFQKDEKEDNYESTTESVLGSTRAQSKNEELISGRVINNTNKKEQESVKNTGSTNKQPFRNSNSANNNEKDHKNNNREKTITGKKYKPINRHTSNNDVIDSTNTKSKLGNNEDEDSAQPNEYLSSEEPRRRKSSSRGKVRGKQADENSCESQEEYDDGQKTTSQGAEPKHLPKMVQSEGTQAIQGEESKILPPVVINVTTVLPPNKSSTATSSVPTTVTTSRTQSTLQLSNNSTTSRPPTNAKSKKWKKALDIFGKVIGVFTVIGGAFYLVYSVM